MPELKNSFTKGKMNKDLDERIIPSNEYREALNIGVATSEDSDVGAAQNILGNVLASCAIQGPFDIMGGDRKYANASSHITAIADPMTDMIYRFVATNGNSSGVWMDRIIEFNTTAPVSMPCTSIYENLEIANKEAAVMIDVYKVRTVTSSRLRTECTGGNAKITVNQNIFQIRHGMMVVSLNTNFIEESDQVYITQVDILSSTEVELTLSSRSDGRVVDDLPDGTELILEADRVLNFSTSRYITGINILDGMIFWTDNYSEPKKVNIERSKLGSIVERDLADLQYGLQNFDQHTKLICNKYNPRDHIKVSPSICP